METRIFQGIFLHPRRGKGLGSLARTVHAMEGKSDECRDFNTSGSHSKRSAKAACCFPALTIRVKPRQNSTQRRLWRELEKLVLLVR